MRRFTFLVVLALFSLSVVTVGAAVGKPIVVVNGGGIVQNNNSTGTSEPELLSVGGFTAIVKDHKKKGLITRGQVQAKMVLANDPTNTLASIHGKVVCVREIDDSDVWEVRFQVTRATGEATIFFEKYGSLLVFDGGTPGAGNDWLDESFHPAFWDIPGCGNLVEGVHFGLEPVLAGNFTVHQ